MEHFSFDVSHDAGGALVVAHGEIDMLAAPALLRIVDELADGDGAVVIDLRPADFIDSSGFSALVRAHRRLGERVTLVRPLGRVARALTATGLDGAGRSRDRERRELSSRRPRTRSAG